MGDGMGVEREGEDIRGEGCARSERGGEGRGMRGGNAGAGQGVATAIAMAMAMVLHSVLCSQGWRHCCLGGEEKGERERSRAGTVTGSRDRASLTGSRGVFFSPP